MEEFRQMAVLRAADRRDIGSPDIGKCSAALAQVPSANDEREIPAPVSTANGRCPLHPLHATRRKDSVPMCRGRLRPHTNGERER
ncbi:hypothetical protein MPTK1_3g00990 [Marchantia polymorpha subsp. ruderalis]|uniref:Uncharacterized protein n=2 Tax=Marchantia polymorpha TaxID=3197 RepID=A0AAF6AW34_MARPO|nr:hypothetical protein MARPO_0007s0095 [Marchantia polymorpha]BBN03968.1 hypothetical protein Mp_3g00990 [Marchantia polymorpha subsp. ruderalis]|eukprot:PTQ47657.1 hypothetical protein MARPO_0007s0095 [Marchantia polymorpha]